MSNQNADTAARLEELAAVLKDFVLDFRNDMYDASLYARLYWLRREITYLIRNHGIGLPDSAIIDGLNERYGTYKDGHA